MKPTEEYGLQTARALVTPESIAIADVEGGNQTRRSWKLRGCHQAKSGVGYGMLEGVDEGLRWRLRWRAGVWECLGREGEEEQIGAGLGQRESGDTAVIGHMI